MARQLVRRNPAVQDEISAAISRMEAMMRAQGKRQPYRPPAPLPVSNSSVSPSRSASTVGPVTSPAPVRPIFGPVDAKGNPIVPRSAYLRSFVAPAASAPPAHTDANDDTISYILNHGRRRTTSPLRSTVLRKLQEDLAECTFQPNAKRIQNQPRQQSSNDLAQSKDDLASNDPPTKSHAYPPVYQRLYKAETHHLSATFAQKWGPHTVPSESKDRSPPQKQRPATAAAATATATAPPPKKASRPAAASQAKSAPSAAAHDIFKRLYNDGLTKLTEKTRTDTAAKSRQDKRAEACNAKTQQHLAKMAADVQQRERNIQLMRERAIELERRYIEGKRKELLEHVRRHPGTYHHTNAGPPASTLAHSRGAVVVHPKPNRPGAGAAPPPPDNDVHHSTTSSGVDSTMVLTPNGTWTRRPLASSAAPVPPPALEDANNTNNATAAGGGDEANSGTTGNSPGRSRPPGISPLLLSKLHKAS